MTSAIMSLRTDVMIRSVLYSKVQYSKGAFMALPGVFNTDFLSVITIGSDPHGSAPRLWNEDPDPATQKFVPKIKIYNDWIGYL
jgi:hypothetical protein